MALHRLATALVSWCYRPFVAVCLRPCAAIFSPQTLQHFPPPPPINALRYENCEMRTVVLADEGGAYGHPCRTHFHGGHAVKADG